MGVRRGREDPASIFAINQEGVGAAAEISTQYHSVDPATRKDYRGSGLSSAGAGRADASVLRISHACDARRRRKARRSAEISCKAAARRPAWRARIWQDDA